MTATDTITDVDLEALWKEALPCHWYECDTEPTHKTVMPCCGKEYYWCQPHTERQRQFAVEAEAGKHGIIECRACGTSPIDPTKILIRTI